MKDITKFIFTEAEIETVAEAIYAKDGKNYKVQGFRPGKAPRKIIEQNHGPVFFEPALNSLFNKAYGEYLKKNPNIRAIDDPEVEIKQKGDTYELTVTTDIQPPFTLGKYKGLEIKAEKLAITDKEVDRFLERVALDRTRQVAAPKDHKIVKGNIAVIDFVGSVNGVEFQGGTAKNHELEIGTKSFIDTFEDQLVGKKVGDKIDIKVTFPKEYHAKELAGKPALFKTEVRNILIKEVPKIDDNLAKESSEFENLVDYKKDIKARLEKQAASESEKLTMDKLIQTICDNTKIDINPKLVDNQYQQDMYEIEQRLAQTGFSLEDYVKYNGMDFDVFKKNQREQARQRTHFILVIDAIVKKEGIKSDFASIEKFLKEVNKIC